VSIHVLGDEDTVLGFRLAGIRGTVAKSGAGLTEQFRALVGQREAKIVLVTEDLARSIRPLVDQYRMRGTFPVVVEIPDAEGPLPGRRSIEDLIREAVGIQV
jgi:V/A-type H+-transporting ATPase subunit F